jgi:hypothetical protein
LQSRAKRREAIQVLPKTLDDFYHRLLEDIDDDNLNILKKALIWLLLSARALTVAELAEAVIISPTRPFFDPDERFDDEQSLLTIIPGGFVRILPDSDDFERSSAEGQSDENNGNSAKISPRIQLGHRSVKDYLVSSRVVRQEFQIDSLLAHKVLKETCAAYLLSVAQAFTRFREDPFEEFPLLSYVSTYWPYHLNGVEHHDLVLVRHLAVAFSQGSLESLLTQSVMQDDERGYLLANELLGLCSRGSPCEQCTRISLKRYQTLVPYFNDSSPSQPDRLGTFLISGTEIYASFLWRLANH